MILTQEHIEFLEAFLTEDKNVFSTISDIRTRMIEAYPYLDGISLATIHNAIKTNGFSWKKVSRRPTKRNIDITKMNRVLVSRKLIYCLYHGIDVIFVDETSIHLNAKPNYGWGKKGQQLSIQAKPRSKNYSIISAITQNTVLGCQIIKGGVKGKDFLGFIVNLLRFYEMEKICTHIVIFLDNARMHHAKIVQESLKNKVTFLFNAAYSPMLNPIEEFFSKFKKEIRKMDLRNDEELITATQHALTTFTPDNIKGYLRHTLKFAEDSLNNVDMP